MILNKAGNFSTRNLCSKTHDLYKFDPSPTTSENRRKNLAKAIRISHRNDVCLGGLAALLSCAVHAHIRGQWPWI